MSLWRSVLLTRTEGLEVQRDLLICCLCFPRVLIQVQNLLKCGVKGRHTRRVGGSGYTEYYFEAYWVGYVFCCNVKIAALLFQSSQLTRVWRHFLSAALRDVK
jgi:hypothetical protein